MTRFAVVHAETTAIAHTGRGVPILPGRYEVVEIDGAADRGVMYVTSTAGTLVCVDPLDADRAERGERAVGHQVIRDKAARYLTTEREGS